MADKRIGIKRGGMTSTADRMAEGFQNDWH